MEEAVEVFERLRALLDRGSFTYDEINDCAVLLAMAAWRLCG